MKIEKSGVCVRCGVVLKSGADVRGTCPRCMLAWAFAEDPNATRAAPRSDDEPVLEGKFGAYEIEGLLGRGGMGVVYKARQPNLDRVVAIKVLPDSLARDAEFTERFQREARAMAALSHPNIVAVHDFGCIDGRFYIAMEHVEGKSVRAMLQEGPLPPERALAIIPELCDAIQFAHRQGVVHRDIKPENILVGVDGRVKVADFGLAKMAGKSAVDFRSLTRSDHIVGTLHYMAPEQIERPKEVDHRADIYSLGVVIYEMLTGELPLGRFDPPSHRSLASAQLDHVVMKSLEKQPERRYQEVSELKEEMLRPPRSAPAPQAWPNFGGRSPARLGDRRRAWVAAGAGSVVAVGMLLSVGMTTKKVSVASVPAPVAPSFVVTTPSKQTVWKFDSQNVILPATAMGETVEYVASPAAGEEVTAMVVYATLEDRIKEIGEPGTVSCWRAAWEMRHEDPRRFREVFQKVLGSPEAVAKMEKALVEAQQIFHDTMNVGSAGVGRETPGITLEQCLERSQQAGAAVVPGFVKVLSARAEVGNSDVPAPLESPWQSPVENVHVVRSLRALALLKYPETVAPILNALGNENPRVRSEALRTLEQLTGQRFADRQEAQNWWRGEGGVWVETELPAAKPEVKRR